jgi:Zn-dependent metalloprotease
MCNKNHIHTINCIVPPHMLDVLVMRGDKKIRKMAQSLLNGSKKIREARQEVWPSSLVVATKNIAGLASRFVTPALANTKPKANTPNRTIYDGDNKASLPGTAARIEGDAATGDSSVDEAYDGAGHVYDLYRQEFDRDSLDGNGMPLMATVHHRRNYNNAFWDGYQMAYGDGDGEIFRKFTDLSVIGHEMSHGVVQYSGGLKYEGQSGALNESFADVFGVLTVQRAFKQTVEQANWLVGEDILGPDINGVALRSLKAPGTAYNDILLGQDPQPYHLDLYVTTTDDYGGVHINSGIPNHAFYLFAQYLGGYSWQEAGKIWYLAMQTLNNPHATFVQWAEQTLKTCINLYGLGSRQTIMLRRAWKLVGLNV